MKNGEIFIINMTEFRVWNLYLLSLKQAEMMLAIILHKTRLIVTGAGNVSWVNHQPGNMP